MKSDRSRGKKSGLHRWELRDLEAEEVDRLLGVEPERDRRRRIRDWDGGGADDERKVEIEREGYVAGWGMSVPSWGCPFKGSTWQAKAWKAGHDRGWRARLAHDRGDEPR